MVPSRHFMTSALALALLVGCRSPEASKDDPHQARIKIITAYENRPDSYQGAEIFTVVEAYLREGQFQRALRLASDYTARAPNDSAGWLAVGHCNLKLGRYDESLADYQKADSLGNPEALRCIASVYIYTEEWQNVKALWPRLLEYVHGKKVEDTGRLVALAVMIVAVTELKPKDYELFEQCLTLLPRATNKWLPSQRTTVAETLEEAHDHQRLKIYRKGINPAIR